MRNHVVVRRGACLVALCFGGALGCGRGDARVTDASGPVDPAPQVDAAGTAGAPATGGTPETGGTLETGGAMATGGTQANGGAPATGGAPAGGGAMATGGVAKVDAGIDAFTGTGDTGTMGDATGICPIGVSFPVPSLTGTPALVYAAPSTGPRGQFEGAVWLSASSRLLFSDMSTGSGAPVVPSQILAWTPPDTVSTLVVDAGTNGMAIDRDGNVYACSHQAQGIVKVDLDRGTVSIYVDNIGGKKFNSPNDLVVRSDGTLYFTDPDFQLGTGRVSQTGVKGVYRVSPSLRVTAVDATFSQPNGINLSPDESVLYVADYGGNTIYAFDVDSDGGTRNRRAFATVSGPDGMAVDCAGNLYVAENSAGRVQVFGATGTKLGSVAVSTGLTNLAFGGADRKTLYMTAGRSLYRLPLNLPGFPN